MAIPIGPIKPLLDLYRKAWREAGHPGDGEVMIAFHMFCHEDARAAREIPRAPSIFISKRWSNPPANGRKARRRRITRATTSRSAA